MKTRSELEDHLRDELEFYYPRLPEDEIDYLLEAEMDDLEGELFVHDDKINTYAYDLAHQLIDIPENLRCYFEFNQYAEDLKTDFTIYETPFHEVWYVVGE